MLRCRTLLRTGWFILCVSGHQALQLIKEVKVIIELQLPKLPVRVPGMLVHVTEPVDMLGIQPYQRASQAFYQE